MVIIRDESIFLFCSMKESMRGFLLFSDPTLTWWHCLYTAYRYRVISSYYTEVEEAKGNSNWMNKDSPTFARKHSFASVIELLFYTFSHSWITSICFGQPISVFSTDGPILLSILSWFLIFCSPFDFCFKILGVPGVQFIISFIESAKKSKDFLFALDAASKLYPKSVLGPAFIAFLQVFAGHFALFLFSRLHESGANFPLRNEIYKPSTQVSNHIMIYNQEFIPFLLSFFKSIMILGLFSALTSTPHGKSVLALSTKGSILTFGFKNFAFSSPRMSFVSKIISFLEKWSQSLVWTVIAYFYLCHHFEKLVKVLILNLTRTSEGSKEVQPTATKGKIDTDVKRSDADTNALEEDVAANKKSNEGFLSSHALKKAKEK